ncbi:MAG TPA: site-specific DNA-methyltransferase [Candidatus Competibacteraceae bacterium]|nr:site-specific DNA-methyltransferase [Candidatus Competibacteraceae bacterium]HRZ05893.1 site-specific DNA-methyltransferase [Candidatus Competibacteraceae bacterium]HSA46362.1 site-specific DNA-methyltransferase [Candidatus Competibacteraceae bacterium]
MAARGRKKAEDPAPAPELIADYRFDAKRTNIPPAGLAAQGKLEESRRIRYAYDPHRPPVLRFDNSGAADQWPELLTTAQQRALTREEIALLAEALRQQQPWLEWAGKREKRGFEVEPVALHMHERIAAQAIVKVAARQDVQRDLFADPKLSYREAVQFYQHDIDWANRMILGDSLQVMASLARRENLAGRVQMIYVDPPYGIKFASNFQPEVGKRDVKDKESDLTREPEMVKAYRDTWTLGVHSYLAYLRDRLIVAKELLADSGSIFVQISDENLHRVRMVMDEVFGAENFCAVIPFVTTSSQTSILLSRTNDYLLWFARDRQRVKFRQLFSGKEIGGEGASKYTSVECASGERGPASVFADGKRFRPSPMVSQSGGENSAFDVDFEGVVCVPRSGYWKTNQSGIARLIGARRIVQEGRSIAFVRYLEDFPVYPLSSFWEDTWGVQSRSDPKRYVVQTSSQVIERCLLMTTDPGDLVLDPTCGSGTTAYVAEQWGRRWITIDTSRVALALARQRLLTAKFDYFALRELNDDDRRRNPKGQWLKTASGGIATLDCETVPHVTLKSIAQNSALDAIFARHQPGLDAALVALNAEVGKVGKDLRQKLATKLAAKQKTEGKRAITEADRRRWLLPPANRDPKIKLTVDAAFPGWYEWEAPFDTDPDWPQDLQTALTAYRTAWRAKMDEVNAAIAANADNEELVDKPRIRKNVVRVSGPFTMEAVMPSELTLDEPSPMAGADEDLDGFAAESVADAPQNTEAFLDKMIRLLAADGVRFPNNKVAVFSRLSPMGEEFLHAEGEWELPSPPAPLPPTGEGSKASVAVSIGPEFGPVTAWQVENALFYAARRGFDNLVFAGFSFDAAAQATIQDDPNPRVRCHLAHIRPDVNMGNLLKDTPNAQLFSVFGSPRVALNPADDSLFTVTLEGVDIYNPVENTILATKVDKVAAWFVDTDYDGRVFCITQAFFPDKSAWEKLAKALKSVVDESAFEALSGTESLPFAAGKHQRVAVKVIDPRGNEVMRVLRLEGQATYGA